jgi:hypothetical protein
MADANLLFSQNVCAAVTDNQLRSRRTFSEIDTLSSRWRMSVAAILSAR